MFCMYCPPPPKKIKAVQSQHGTVRATGRDPLAHEALFAQQNLGHR